jgi:hypothetical protein
VALTSLRRTLARWAGGEPATDEPAVDAPSVDEPLRAKLGERRVAFA